MPAVPGGPGSPNLGPLGKLTKKPPASSSSGSANISQTPGSPCLISFPSVGLPLVGSVGGGCLLSKTNVRAMLGFTLGFAGGFGMIIGAALLVAAGFKKTGVLGKAADAAAVIPGGQGVAAGLHAAQGRATRTGAQASRARVASRETAVRTEQKQMKQLGEPKENPALRPGPSVKHESGSQRAKRYASVSSSNGHSDPAPF